MRATSAVEAPDNDLRLFVAMRKVASRERIEDLDEKFTAGERRLVQEPNLAPPAGFDRRAVGVVVVLLGSIRSKTVDTRVAVLATRKRDYLRVYLHLAGWFQLPFGQKLEQSVTISDRIGSPDSTAWSVSPGKLHSTPSPRTCRRCWQSRTGRLAIAPIGPRLFGYVDQKNGAGRLPSGEVLRSPRQNPGAIRNDLLDRLDTKRDDLPTRLPPDCAVASGRWRPRETGCRQAGKPVLPDRARRSSGTARSQRPPAAATRRCCRPPRPPTESRVPFSRAGRRPLHSPAVAP